MDNMNPTRRGEIYYWIKIRHDLMHSKEVKLLMRQPDGGWYFSIYIYLVMLSINSNGRLIQKVGEMEMVYDLTTITQELMFFKIDTIRVAIEMLKSLNLLYEDEGHILCITNFSNMVGSTSGWADIKRKQREKDKLLKQSIDVDNVHPNVHIEIRDKRLEYRDNNKEIKSIDHNDSNDKNDNNDKVTLTSDSLNIDSIQNLMLNEWHNTFKDSHVFTKYLVYSKYLEEGNVDALISANSFFESYLDKYYHFDDLKNHVQYFLFQYRKLSKAERSKITNRMGYLTNAIKSNQRTLEWKASDEFKQLQKVETIAGKRLKKDAEIYFPNDIVRQELYYDKYFFTYIGEETSKIRSEFNKKCSVK